MYFTVHFVENTLNDVKCWVAVKVRYEQVRHVGKYDNGRTVEIRTVREEKR